MSKLVKERHKFIHPKIDRVIWCSKYRTSVPDLIENEVEPFVGPPSQELIDRLTNEKIPTILVLDDLAREAYSSSEVSTLFLSGRHASLSLILLTNNFFSKEKFTREISINCSHIILMSNSRDNSFLVPLSHQVDPINSRRLTSVFLSHCNKPFSYLLCDFSNHIPQSLKYRANIFDDMPHVLLSESQVEELKYQENQPHTIHIEVVDQQ